MTTMTTKTAWRLVALGSLAMAAAVARLAAQGTPPQPTVDVIHARYVTATGGRAAQEKITTLSAQGTIDIPDAGISGTFQLFQKAPDKAATIIDLNGIGRQREGFDGTIGWDDNPQTGIREKTGAELADSRRNAVFGRELKLRTLYQTLTLKGRDRVGARDAYVIEAVPASGTPSTMYFDVESGLMTRQLVTRQTPEGPLQIDVTFDDFREVDGVKRPFILRQATPTFTAVIQLSEIKHNVSVDDAVFKKPS